MEKIYWAVVAGRPVPVEGRIDLPLVARRGFPRRAGGGGRPRRQGRGARDHRLPHARPRRPQAGLAGTAPADRAHPPAARALRRASARRSWAMSPTAPRAARPIPTAPARTPRWSRGSTSACTCMRAGWCCRTRPAARSRSRRRCRRTCRRRSAPSALLLRRRGRLGGGEPGLCPDPTARRKGAVRPIRHDRFKARPGTAALARLGTPAPGAPSGRRAPPPGPPSRPWPLEPVCLRSYRCDNRRKPANTSKRTSGPVIVVLARPSVRSGLPRAGPGVTTRIGSPNASHETASVRQQPVPHRPVTAAGRSCVYLSSCLPWSCSPRCCRRLGALVLVDPNIWRPDIEAAVQAGDRPRHVHIGRLSVVPWFIAHAGRHRPDSRQPAGRVAAGHGHRRARRGEAGAAAAAGRTGGGRPPAAGSPRHPAGARRRRPAELASGHAGQPPRRRRSPQRLLPAPPRPPPRPPLLVPRAHRGWAPELARPQCRRADAARPAHAGRRRRAASARRSPSPGRGAMPGRRSR